MFHKSVLITGAGSGIGKACALRMAKEGYNVVVADINMSTAAEVVKEITDDGNAAIAVFMDVTSETSVAAGFDTMMETYGSCDLVMSNAGIQIVHPFEEYPFEDWRKMMAIHADGAFLVARAAYRRMKASGKGGRIVFTGSVQSFVGSKLKEPYNFAKHGVAGLAKSIAREGAEHGIYTYTICPSFIKTPLVEKQIPEQAQSLGITEEEVVKNIMLRDTVDGEFTTVEDVANTLAFLANDQGALTGQSLRLTHGWAMM
jgi:3-hydroxybutyrate dehydrogenase